MNTLIIACGDYGLNKLVEFDSDVFIYFLRDGMLQRHDELEKARIQYFIEEKGCNQVVFAGTMDKSTINKINEGDSLHSLRETLRFNCGPLQRDQPGKILAASMRDQMLLELLVISQCEFLMQYWFVRQRVEKGQLQIRGIIAEPHDEFVKSKIVFFNGIAFNNIIAMN